MALAVLIGVSLGVLGSGGSIVTLPVLVYIAHVPAKEAVGMSMAIVGATSLLGAFIHWRRGNVDTKAALIFSLFGMAGAFLGSTGTHLLSKQVLLLLFAGVMLIVGSLMLRGGPRLDRYRVCHIPRCLLVGFAVGLLTGFLGVGGGFLVVPALVVVLRLPMSLAVGTSLFIIVVNAASSVLSRTADLQLDWMVIGPFAAAAIAASLVAKRVACTLSGATLSRAFAFMIGAVGLFVAAESLAALTS